MNGGPTEPSSNIRLSGRQAGRPIPPFAPHDRASTSEYFWQPVRRSPIDNRSVGLPLHVRLYGGLQYWSGVRPDRENDGRAWFQALLVSAQLHKSSVAARCKVPLVGHLPHFAPFGRLHVVSPKGPTTNGPYSYSRNRLGTGLLAQTKTRKFSKLGIETAHKFFPGCLRIELRLVGKHTTQSVEKKGSGLLAGDWVRGFTQFFKDAFAIL
jgi:hypothetical protein